MCAPRIESEFYAMFLFFIAVESHLNPNTRIFNIYVQRFNDYGVSRLLGIKGYPKTEIFIATDLSSGCI